MIDRTKCASCGAENVRLRAELTVAQGWLYWGTIANPGAANSKGRSLLFKASERARAALKGEDG